MAERPTPCSIAVCTLIALHSDPSSPLHEIDFNPHENDDPVGKFLEGCVVDHSGSLSGSSTNAAGAAFTSADRTLRFTVGTRLSQFFHQLEEYVNLAKTIENKDGDDDRIDEAEDDEESVANLLFQQLGVASASIDALMDLMDSLRAAISEGLVDAVSVHGVYLRQICLGFEELSFESVNLLWDAMKQELREATENRRNSSRDTTDQRTGGETSFATTGRGNITGQNWPQSTEQTERLLRKACLALQHGSTAISVGDGGADTPPADLALSIDQSFEATEMEIRKLLEHEPELPAAYFLRYLNCLQHGERIGALDALHQYFDHAMIQQSTPKDILQFAAILLASTHSAFGDKQLSFLATDEAVRVAQQSKDAACVAFALGWLYNNSDGRHGPEGGELLRRCVTRAAQGQLRQLFSGANMTLAQHYLEDGGALPAEAWTRLIDASTDVVTDNLVTLDRPTHMNESIQEAMECLARQRLVAAGIWDCFGLPAVSELSSVVALHCHGGTEHLMTTEVLAAIQNVARGALYGSQQASNLLSRQSSLQSSPASWLQPHQVSPSDDPESSCIYSTSLRQLLELRSYYQLRGVAIDDLFLHNACLVLHEWAVRRGDLDDAEALGLVLESHLHPRLSNYYQVMVDVLMQKSLRLARRGQWDNARAVTRHLIEICEKRGFKTHHAKLLIQLAHFQLESSSGRFISALSPLLECLSMCERCNMDGTHATGLSILAKVFLRMRNPKRAVAILQASLPSMLQQEHVWYQADALLTLAKCHLQLAASSKSTMSANTPKRSKAYTKRLRTAARELRKSRDLFQQCHDLIRLREVLYLLAGVYASLEEVDERDLVSKQFIQVSAYVQNKKSNRNRTELDGSSSSNILDDVTQTTRLEQLASRALPITAH